MITKITARGFRVKESLHTHLDWHVGKIIQRLPHLKADLLKMDLVIKKISHKFLTDKGHVLDLYEGSFNLTLPRDRLHVNFEGRSTLEGINNGIGLLKKELKRYKEKHFTSDSHYPNHKTIRG